MASGLANASFDRLMPARRIRIRRLIWLLAIVATGVFGRAYWVAVSDPVVRRTEVALLPPDDATEELRLLLISDIHVAGPDMPPARLRRIADQANDLKADVVVIAGDLISDKRAATKTYSLRDAVAPLGGLSADLGVLAVLDNHDHWRDAAEARDALHGVGIRTLDNSAAAVGPLVIGGLDDAFTNQDDLEATLQAMRRHEGVSHSLVAQP